MDKKNADIGSFSRKICFIPSIVFGPEAGTDLSMSCGPRKKDIGLKVRGQYSPQNL